MCNISHHDFPKVWQILQFFKMSIDAEIRFKTLKLSYTGLPESDIFSRQNVQRMLLGLQEISENYRIQ